MAGEVVGPQRAAAGSTGAVAVRGEVAAVRADIVRVPDALASRLAGAERAVALTGTAGRPGPDGSVPIRTALGEVVIRTGADLPAGRVVTLQIPLQDGGLAALLAARRPIPTTLILPGTTGVAGATGGAPTQGAPAIAGQPTTAGGGAAPPGGITGLPTGQPTGPTGGSQAGSLGGTVSPPAAGALTGGGGVTHSPPSGGAAATMGSAGPPGAGATGWSGAPPSQGGHAPAAGGLGSAGGASLTAGANPASGAGAPSGPAPGLPAAGNPAAAGAAQAPGLLLGQEVAPRTGTPSNAQAAGGAGTAQAPPGTTPPGSNPGARPAGAGTAAGGAPPALPPGLAALIAAGRGDRPALPALAETLAALIAADPAAARQVARAALPQPGGPLAGAMLLFLSVVRGGDVCGWLGERGVRALETAGKGELIGRLGAELAQTARPAGEPATGGEWRQWTLPMLADGQLQALRFAVPQDRQDDDGDDPRRSGGGKRFLIDLDLTRLGALQLDGRVAAPRFDLTCRSRRPLPQEMRAELGPLFRDAAAATGFEGALVFEAGDRGWVALATDRARAVRV